MTPEFEDLVGQFTRGLDPFPNPSPALERGFQAPPSKSEGCGALGVRFPEESQQYL